MVCVILIYVFFMPKFFNIIIMKYILSFIRQYCFSVFLHIELLQFIFILDITSPNTFIILNTISINL